MKRFQAYQAQKSFKLNDNCVELSMHVVLGGGQFRAYPTRG